MQGEGTTPRDNVDRRIAYDKSTVSSYKRVLPNDFILHLRSFEGGLEIVNEEGVVSPAYTVLRAQNEIIPLFFYTFFRSYWFINNKLRISVEGIRDGKSINMNTFWHIKVPVPSIEEQRHISALISFIDKRIKVAENEHRRLLQIRTGLDATALYINNCCINAFLIISNAARISDSLAILVPSAERNTPIFSCSSGVGT